MLDPADDVTQELRATIKRMRERLDYFAEVLVELGFDPEDLLDV
jgi:hypothetical protein